MMMMYDEDACADEDDDADGGDDVDDDDADGVDIDDKYDMQEYHSLSMDTTNNAIYKNWLDSHLNQSYIINFFQSLNQIMVSEYTNYIRLKSLK